MEMPTLTVARSEAPSRRFTEIAAESGLSEGTVRALLQASGAYESRKREINRTGI